MVIELGCWPSPDAPARPLTHKPMNASDRASHVSDHKLLQMTHDSTHLLSWPTDQSAATAGVRLLRVPLRHRITAQPELAARVLVVGAAAGQGRHADSQDALGTTVRDRSLELPARRLESWGASASWSAIFTSSNLNGAVLDIGCGEGLLFKRLQTPAARATLGSTSRRQPIDKGARGGRRALHLRRRRTRSSPATPTTSSSSTKACTTSWTR